LIYWLAKAEEGWFVCGLFSGRETEFCKCASRRQARQIVAAIWRAQAGLPPEEQ
jgi:hypothetical protein